MIGDRGPEGSSRQAGAALVATALQHGTTGAGAHPSAETVLLCTAMGVWLKSTLHVVLLKALNRRDGGLTIHPSPGPGACCCDRGAKQSAPRPHNATVTHPRAATRWHKHFPSTSTARRRAALTTVSPTRCSCYGSTPCPLLWLSTPVDNRVDVALTSGYGPSGTAAGRCRFVAKPQARVAGPAPPRELRTVPNDNERSGQSARVVRSTSEMMQP